MPQDDVRVYWCERCGRYTAICRSCDHGHHYCDRCAPLASIERGRRSSARYQSTEKGRANHKKRQQVYLERLAQQTPSRAPGEMTQRAIATAPGSGDLREPSARGSRDARPTQPKRRPHLCPPGGHRVRCDFCQKVYVVVCRSGHLPPAVPRRPQEPRVGRVFVRRGRGP